MCQMFLTDLLGIVWLHLGGFRHGVCWGTDWLRGVQATNKKC